MCTAKANSQSEAIALLEVSPNQGNWQLGAPGTSKAFTA